MTKIIATWPTKGTFVGGENFNVTGTAEPFSTVVLRVALFPRTADPENVLLKVDSKGNFNGEAVVPTGNGTKPDAMIAVLVAITGAGQEPASAEYKYKSPS